VFLFHFRNHIPVLSSFMTYHRVCNHSNATGVANRVGIAYSFHLLSSPPAFSVFPVAQSLFFCVVFWRLLFVFFRLAIVSSVGINFPFGVFEEGSLGFLPSQTCWLICVKFLLPINNTFQ
jgi:hypothetical protein